MSRWSFIRRTPSVGEIAYKLAMSYGASFGPTVRWYAPASSKGLKEGSEEFRAAVRWLWVCPRCRVSETGLATREVAIDRRHAHKGRCGGVEPDRVRSARETYTTKLDREDRRRPRSIHRHAESGATRILADSGDPGAIALHDVARECD